MTIEQRLNYPAEAEEAELSALHSQFVTTLEELKAKLAGVDPELEWRSPEDADCPGLACKATWLATFKHTDKTGTERDLTIEYREYTEVFDYEGDGSALEAIDKTKPIDSKKGSNHSYELRDGEDVLAAGYVEYGEDEEIERIFIDEGRTLVEGCSEVPVVREEAISLDALRQATGSV